MHDRIGQTRTPRIYEIHGNTLEIHTKYTRNTHGIHNTFGIQQNTVEYTRNIYRIQQNTAEYSRIHRIHRIHAKYTIEYTSEYLQDMHARSYLSGSEADDRATIGEDHEEVEGCCLAADIAL